MMKSFTEPDHTCQGLPLTLLACNVPDVVFVSEMEQKQFQDMFSRIGVAEFIYLPSFHRVRIKYETPEQATEARISLDKMIIKGETINIFFGHAQSDIVSNPSLIPPIEEKTFLISPPASPPVGWTQVVEDQPVFNFELISALVELSPGQSHELHKGTSSTPSVVVHICEDSVDSFGRKIAQNRIQQTRRPGT